MRELVEPHFLLSSSFLALPHSPGDDGGDYGGDGGDDGDVDDYDVDDDDNVGMSGILCWATILLERLYFPCFFNQQPSLQF